MTSTSAEERRSRLVRALGSAEQLTAFPDGRVDTLPVVKETFAAADDLARVCELQPFAERVIDISEGWTGPALALSDLVLARCQDALVLGGLASELRIERCDYAGDSAEAPGLGFRLVDVGDELELVRADPVDEQAIITFTSGCQLFVRPHPDTEQGMNDYLEEFGGATRGRDPFGLNGGFTKEFQLGAGGLRAAWGLATVTVTSQKLMGVFSSSTYPLGNPPERESLWMPRTVHTAHASSVVAFAADRSAFGETEAVTGGRKRSRQPYLNLYGEDAVLAIDVNGIVEHGRARMPQKHEIATTLGLRS